VKSSKDLSRKSQDGKNRKKKRRREETRRKKQKKKKVIDIKKIADGWEIWDEEGEAMKSEEKVKKLVLERFHK